MKSYIYSIQLSPKVLLTDFKWFYTIWCQLESVGRSGLMFSLKN